jgi:hypothetical protein
MGTTIERINELSAERGRLYGQAGNGRRGDVAVLQRIKELTDEIGRLWTERRMERAGHRDGIDLLVDRAYQDAYGRSYEETVFPTPVAEPDDVRELARLAA